jgi:hypothetical protein
MHVILLIYLKTKWQEYKNLSGYIAELIYMRRNRLIRNRVNLMYNLVYKRKRIEIRKRAIKWFNKSTKNPI